MSKLDNLIQQLCPNGVEWKTLGDVCEVLDTQRKPVTKAARCSGYYPYYGANGIQDYVSDYIFDGTFVLVGEDGSVKTSNGNPVVNWAIGKIWVNNHAHVISEKKGCLLRYLYHFIQTIDITNLVHGNIPKLTQGDFKSLEIPVPPLPIQEEIVRILDSFTSLTAELQAELQARRVQYEWYREKLLNNTDNNYKTARLGDVFEIVTDYVAAGSFAETAKNVVYKSEPNFAQLVRTMDIKSGFSKGAPVYVDERAFQYLWRVDFDEPCIILPNIGVNCGEIYYVKPEHLPYKRNVLGPNAIMLKKCSHNLKYLYYYFQNKDFQNNLSKIISPGGQTKFNKTELKKIVLYLSSLSEQQRIVDILDRFDAYCNDITQGLPAEIEARQKQYEYYRDKLLTFKKVEE